VTRQQRLSPARIHAIALAVRIAAATAR
jgi:hypothetical protein